MTDCEKAIEALEKAGFVQDKNPSVWYREEDGRTSAIVIVEKNLQLKPTPGCFVYEGDLEDLPSLLSSLTLEDVERAIEETRTEVGSWENAQCRVGAFVALDDLVRRLHRQVNGDTCNREEG